MFISSIYKLDPKSSVAFLLMFSIFLSLNLYLKEGGWFKRLLITVKTQVRFYTWVQC